MTTFTNALTARLLCEHCHGIGWIQSATGKIACGECNPQKLSANKRRTDVSEENKCRSVDNETFNCETLGELLDNNADELKAGMTVYVADAEPPNIALLCDADDVLETIGCRADDMAGEYAEDCARVSAEAKVELNALLAAWIQKHCSLNFWTVRNAKEYVLTEADFKTSEVVSNHQEMSGGQG